MKKLFTLLVAAVMTVACCFGLTACGEKEKPVVGLITLHGEASTYDKNFIDAFKAACQKNGLKESQYRIVTDIDEGSVCYDTAADLVDKGCKGIFADSFGHEQFMIQAAKAFKDVQFYHATGVNALAENLSNFHNAFASIYEGRYLAGYAAGLKLNTMKDKAVSGVFTVGYVGAYTYAEVISGYTSWFLGLQAALDEGYTAEMKVQFTGSWYDEAGEKTAAETLIEKGCVLISQHADSMGAPTACDTANIPNVAYNGSTGKDTLVAYSKINWEPYFDMMIKNALNGTSVVTDWCGTLETGSVQWALGPNVADGTLAAIQTVEAELKAGTRKVFDCSKFTVDGNPLTTFKVGDKEVVKTADGITYFSESEVMSAPYFSMNIDGIERLNEKF